MFKHKYNLNSIPLRYINKSLFDKKYLFYKYSYVSIAFIIYNSV